MILKSGMYVKVKKIAVPKHPLMPTPEMKDYVAGADNGLVSLPIEYEVEGYLVKVPQLKESISIDRRKRNGIPVFGYFHSSYILKIEDNKISTMNSVYLIEEATP